MIRIRIVMISFQKFFFQKIEWNISFIFIAQNIFLYFSIVSVCFRVLWIDIEFQKIIRIHRIILLQILNSRIDWDSNYFEFVSLYRRWTSSVKSSLLRKKISFLQNRYYNAKFNRNIHNYSRITIWNFYQFDFNQRFAKVFEQNFLTWVDLFSRKLFEHFFRYVCFVIFYCFSTDSFDKLMLLKKHFDIVFFITTFVFHHSTLESQKQWYETHMNSIFSRNYSVKKSQFRWNYWSTYFFRENNQIDKMNHRQNYSFRICI